VTVERVPGPGGPASVVLEIGGDIGAAVVAAPESLSHVEVEIRRRGRPWDGTHVAVRPRHLPGGVLHAALFGSLAAGCYEVRVRPDGAEQPITFFKVEGGQVTTARLG
jgi:hypothetical protein